ncbi:MAG: HPP family protein [Burkholderiaceae bacterium]
MESLQWLHRLVPEALLIDRYERLRTCCGALIGILITGLVSYLLLGPSIALPFLIAPMGASAVLLYAVPASPMAQPWAVVGGNVVSAAVGVLAVKLIGDPPIAAAVGVGGAIGAMFLLRCLHPPGGAAALTAVLGGSAIHEQGFYYVLSPVAINAVLMVGVAILFNNAVRRPYPHRPQPVATHGTKDPRPTDKVGFAPEDLDAVLRNYNQVLDISRDDLENLLMQAERHAYQRRAGNITCADIMSKDVIAVEFGTPLQEAWTLLRRHKIKALPVIDRSRRVIGIVTQSDFMKHAQLDEYHTFGEKFNGFIKRTLHTHSQKPEVVGQIMTPEVKTATTSTHIVELVPLLSDAGFHHVPILNEDRKLAGIVTQSDLVAAIYRSRLIDADKTL